MIGSGGAEFAPGAFEVGRGIDAEGGVADAGAASLRVSGLELGGLFGSLLAGKLSDMLINNSKGSGGNVGKRIQVGAVAGWLAGWLEG